jgi:hypothetical protein
MKDLVLAISPALFGLLGVVLGGLITTHSSSVERRTKEDNEARKELTALLAMVNHAAGRYAPGSEGATIYVSPAPEAASTLNENLNRVQAAVLAAGVPWPTTNSALQDTQQFIDFAEQQQGADAVHPNGLRTDVLAGKAYGGLYQLLRVLDRSRTYRRSATVARRFGVSFSTRHPLLWRITYQFSVWKARQNTPREQPVERDIDDGN